MVYIICIVPARSGSKSIPHKNIRRYDTIPLMAHSIRVAKKCPSIDKVVVSTDSEIYQKIALSFGAEAPFLRPEEFSTDTSLDYEFCKHFIDWNNQNKWCPIPDLIVQLRPTYPNRTPEVVEDCIQKFTAKINSHDSLRTVVPMDYPAYKTYSIQNEHLIPIISELPNVPQPFNQPRQLLPNTYWHNGSVDIIKVSSLLKYQTIHGENILPYVMPKNETYDIDTEEDFEKSLEAFKNATISVQNQLE